MLDGPIFADRGWLNQSVCYGKMLLLATSHGGFKCYENEFWHVFVAVETAKIGR